MCNIFTYDLLVIVAVTVAFLTGFFVHLIAFPEKYFIEWHFGTWKTYPSEHKEEQKKEDRPLFLPSVWEMFYYCFVVFCMFELGRYIWQILFNYFN